MRSRTAPVGHRGRRFACFATVVGAAILAVVLLAARAPGAPVGSPQGEDATGRAHTPVSVRVTQTEVSPLPPAADSLNEPLAQFVHRIREAAKGASADARAALARSVRARAHAEQQARDACAVFDFAKHEELLLVWLRLSKVGGTTLQRHLEAWLGSLPDRRQPDMYGCDHYSNNRVRYEKGDPTLDPVRLQRAQNAGQEIFDFKTCASIKYDLPDLAERRSVRAVIGHQHYGSHKHFPDRTPVYLFVVRDVVECYRSAAQYAGDVVHMEELRSQMLGDPSNLNSRNSQLTVETCGTSDDVLCEPRDTLAAATSLLNLAAQDTIYVDFVDRGPDTLRLLAHKLNYPELASKNVSVKVMPRNKVYDVLSVPDELRRDVQLAHAWDVELYEFARAQMDKQLACIPTT